MDDTSDPDVWMAMDTVATLAAEIGEIGHDFLSHQERLRLSAVVGPRKRAQFLAGRLLMRRLLARVHGGDPLSDWPLTAAVDASPTFIGEAFAQRPSAPWQLSIGESLDYVACAVSSSRVGIDVQMPDPERDVLALGEVMCSVSELIALRDMDDDERGRYFLALWALKEAAIKCESGRSNASALRMLASREISPADLADVLPKLYDADLRSRLRLDAARQGAAGAWTWQSEDLTVAVVSERTGDAVLRREPQWALPPPAFILQGPASWDIRIAPEHVT